MIGECSNKNVLRYREENIQHDRNRVFFFSPVKDYGFGGNYYAYKHSAFKFETYGILYLFVYLNYLHLAYPSTKI